jgi:hypothetical protein
MCLILIISSVVALLGYGVIKLQNRRRRKLKAKQEMTNGKNYDKLCVFLLNLNLLYRKFY